MNPVTSLAKPTIPYFCSIETRKVALIALSLFIILQASLALLGCTRSIMLPTFFFTFSSPLSLIALTVLGYLQISSKKMHLDYITGETDDVIVVESSNFLDVYHESSRGFIVDAPRFSACVKWGNQDKEKVVFSPDFIAQSGNWQACQSLATTRFLKLFCQNEARFHQLIALSQQAALADLYTQIHKKVAIYNGRDLEYCYLVQRDIIVAMEVTEDFLVEGSDRLVNLTWKIDLNSGSAKCVCRSK